jgi:DNA topoisomerase-3
MRLPADGEEAARIAARARTGAAAIESIQAQTQRMAPPPLYDLTELQRHANRLFGFSAQKTLDTAQALYERHKLISYPRTDSRHLSQDVARTLPQIVEAIRHPYSDRLAPGTGQKPLGRRYVDDSKVTDHHAIIPTPTSPERVSLTSDERRIYDLICRRLLSAWHDDHVWSVTTVITAIRYPGGNPGNPVTPGVNAGVNPGGDPAITPAILDRYHTAGSEVRQVGWKVLDLAPRAADARAEQVLPPGLAVDQSQEVTDVQVLNKKTRPPKRLTEATLLTAMETAGKTLDEKELSDAMKETGLGTPATRAAIIEVLLKREYIVRDGKSLEATPKGIRLIEVVHPEVKSPIMTGQWEAYLHRIERGSAQLAPFLKGIEDYVTGVVGKVGAAPAVFPSAAASVAPGAGPRFQPTTEAARAAAREVIAVLRKGAKSTGRLHRELHPEGGMSRDSFEDLLAAMARSGLVRLTNEVFEKEGRVIPYRKASLPDDRAGLEIRLKELAPVPQRRKKADAPGKRRKPRKLP